MDIKILCCIFNVLLVILLVNGTPVPTRQGGKHVLCYFRANSAMRPQPEYRFVPEDIDLTICTHVVYKGTIVGSDLKVASLDSKVDLLENDGLGLLNRTVALKERKPGLKVILGLQDVNAVLRDVAVSNNHEGLSASARNVADFVQSNGFDGVDFTAVNHEGFDKIVAVLHEELAGKGILLMTFYFEPICNYQKQDPSHQRIYFQYEMTESLSRNFDLIVMGSYYHLSGEYTHIFSPLTELLLRKIANSTEGWVVRRDPESQVSYGYSKTRLWVSFEDPVSVRAKAAVILERNLAGAAIMDIDREDFKGVYTENGETFPLTRAAYNALNGESEAERIPNAAAV